MRSLIIAPGDDETRLQAALESGADAVVIDLVVAPGARAAARANAARLLAKSPTLAPALMVRVSPLGDAETDADLDAVMGQAPFAIVLPKCLGGASVQNLSVKLAVREALFGLEDGVTAIIAVHDSASGVLEAPSLRGASARLIGLTWDAEALRAEVGAVSCRDPAGVYVGALRLTRDMTLVAATAAGVAAIDAAFAGGSDPERLRTEALAALRDGFASKMAVDPAQARVINEVFAAGRQGQSG